MMRSLLLQAVAKLACEPGYIPVVRSDARELLSITEGGGDIAAIAVECDQGHECFGIVRMPHEVLLQNLHGFSGLSRRMKRNSVDVGIARSVRLELGRCAQFLQGVVRSLLSDQDKPECMMQPGVRA